MIFAAANDLRDTRDLRCGRWYVLHTRARHEKKVASVLSERSIRTFVPTVREIHRWSDRCKTVEQPLFSCYVFVNVEEWQSAKNAVGSTCGVIRWVGTNGTPASVPEAEISAIHAVLRAGLAALPCPFVRVGQRVRVRGGSLEGVEGILLSKDSGRNRIALSIGLIEKSLAVSMDDYHLEAA